MQILFQCIFKKRDLNPTYEDADSKFILGKVFFQVNAHTELHICNIGIKTCDVYV